MTKRILIVDDEAGVRRTFDRILASAGYATATAESGSAALDALDDEAFDLVLLDLKMPGLNGVQTLREIRKRLPELPVYILTAFQNQFTTELREAAHDGVHFELMHKPIEAARLIEVTRGIFGER